ncbi:uncharacterized protein LOC132702355 [Cylas formicarius]|uniref:uncharacterized protein LOC132702355 n=1 Tax=Cylas formicarius TaxID=197179 RepID=UPI002958CE20|nr:uncharacterized protein LOC132702355 [Cylas formicarius]
MRFTGKLGPRVGKGRLACNNTVSRATNNTPSQLLFGIDQIGETNDCIRLIFGRSINKSVNKKFIPKFKGPYVLKKILNCDRYVIEDSDGFQVTQLPYNGSTG